LLVVVGRIGRPHGVKGSVSIEVRTDEPERRFAVGGRVVTDSGRQLTITSSTWHSGRLLLTFEGYDDRNAIETLRNQVISVDRPDDEQPDDPDEFYDSALMGCEVFADDDAAIGTVVEVAHLPAQDMLIIRTTDDREILVPFVEQFVPTVDITNKRLIITPPEGLLDDSQEADL
jgi:16S rRNA processing protein RimM